jgi:pyruvate,water dikinase
VSAIASSRSLSGEAVHDDEPATSATPVLLVAGPSIGAADAPAVGGKAAGLAWLGTLGFNVPAFFVVTVPAFRAHLRTDSIGAPLAEAILVAADADPCDPEATNALARTSTRLALALREGTLDKALSDQIASALKSLGVGPYAVRSSMVGEDSAEHSFAGQLDSALYQRDIVEVLDSVRGCWSSAFGERALAYASRLGLALADVRMGVVVQRMVNAEVSGVLFTADPISGDRDTCVLSATYGLGEGIVSGLCQTDEYAWSAAGGELKASIAEKDSQVVCCASGRGTEVTPVADDDRRRRVLSTQQVDELGRAGRRLAAAAGRPMDVEWCYADGVLHIVQARPITSLPGTPDRSGPKRVFDNSNVQESYNGVTTPLTFSFASRAYTTTFRLFAKTLGVSEASMVEFEPYARTLIGLVRGRVYYNVNSWLRLLALLPGAERNREDMANVMWRTAIDPLSEERPPRLAGLRRKAEVARVGIRLAWRFVWLDREIRRFLEHFHSIHDQVDRNDLPAATLSDLYDLTRRLYAELLDKWEAPNLNDFRVMMLSGALRRALVKLYPQEEVDSRLGDLLGGIDGIESVEPTRLLVGLACDIRTDATLDAAVRGGEPQQAMRRLRELSPPIAQRIDAYIARYGDRSMGELKLESSPLRENPGFIIGILRNFLDRPDIDPETLTRSERERYQTTLADVTRRLPRSRRALFGWLLRIARKAIKARETLRLRRTLAFGLARDSYRAIGMRLAEADVLEDPRDVLYLGVDELEAFIEGRAISATLAPLAAARKAEYSAYEAENVPNRFETYGCPYIGNEQRDPLGESATSASPERLLHGLGCCAGEVEGAVRLIFSPDDELSLNGRILCTVRTDPGWTPLFPAASGLVIERGSQLSHSAVVAREFGLPTVVGIPNVTRILGDGERVRVDGSAGTVERLDSSDTTDTPR